MFGRCQAGIVLLISLIKAYGFRGGKNKITGLDIFGDNTQISTRLIGIPKSCFGVFLKAVFRRFWKLHRPKTVYEAYLAKGIGADNIHFISPIGVTGSAGSAPVVFNITE